MNLLLLVTIVFVPMLFETFVSRRNEQQLRTMGAAEPHDDVFWMMQVAYPLAFVSMVVEGLAARAWSSTCTSRRGSRSSSAPSC